MYKKTEEKVSHKAIYNQLSKKYYCYSRNTLPESSFFFSGTGYCFYSRKENGIFSTNWMLHFHLFKISPLK